MLNTCLEHSITMPNNYGKCHFQQNDSTTYNTDFNSNGHCVGTDTAQKCTSWLQIEIHDLVYVQILATSQSASLFDTETLKNRL